MCYGDNSYADESESDIQGVELQPPGGGMGAPDSAGDDVESDHEARKHKDEGLLEADAAHI